MHPALSQQLYYLRSTSRTNDRGRFWAYAFHDARGCLLLEAHFPEIPKEVILFEPGQPHTPLLRLKAWRWFWWNGRYDVVAADTGEVLATLRRTGGIESPHRRAIGRVRDATPPRRHFFQALFVGVCDAILAQGNSHSSLSADGFRIEAAGREIGTLRRAALPFLQAEAKPDTAPRGIKGRFMRFFSRLARRLNSSGWRLDFSTDTGQSLDPRVRLAAALFRIQIETRYN